MTPTALSVRGLSKKYAIQHLEDGGNPKTDRLSEAMVRGATAPLRWVKRRLRGQGSGERTEEFWALKDVSFDVRPGEVVGVIGRNGAGKSTLLKLLSRITDATDGEFEIAGRVGSLLEVGTGFHSELTGRENIFLNGAILGMTQREIRKKFDAIVEFAEVSKFLDTPVKRYSSGMYVRLAFAVAAHLEPEILIVDEVLAVGDAEFQKKCLGKMQDVAENSGRTVLFVSHNEAAVKRLCTRAILLEKGVLTFDGTPEEAFKRYRSGVQASGFDASRRLHRSAEMEIVSAALFVDGIETTEVLPRSTATLRMQVHVKADAAGCCELLMRDANSIPVFFAPMGFTHGARHRFTAGLHEVAIDIDLPDIASGRYAIDLMMADPNVRFYDYLEEGLVFNVAAKSHEKTGWQFHQARGQGCILLNLGEAKIRKI